DLRDRTIASLSGGQKQKVAVASVIALHPKVLVLDEPTAELYPASSVAVFDLLARYAREHGTTVIVVEQKIALLSDYADLLVIVDNGRIRVADTPDAVLDHSDDLLA
ncbi:ATP-binding cassette domain-containing protein, partial [Adlercreutzia equolifaciens]|uniref:ATP-binding cassette domain-containing protein n=1 Tax=Adlercreutzia equolifaciens TaxID=446660 RepID=UPI0023AE8B5E